MNASRKKRKTFFSEKVRKKNKKGIRNLLYKTLLGINLCLVLAILLSYLSVYINPSFFALPALFGLAYPFILFLNVVMIIFWAILRKKEAFISLVAILAGIGYFHNFIKLHNQGHEIKSDVKLMSYNVRLFNYYEPGTTNGSEAKIIQLLKKEDPEIICLQEYFYAGNQTTSEQYIKKTLGGTWFTHTKLIARKGNKYYGIITLSRYPVINRGDIDYQKSSSLSIYSDILIGKDTIRVYNNHLQSFRLKRIDNSFLEDITGEGENSFKNMHYFYKRLVDGFKTRSFQTEKLKESISSSPYSVIVAGDLNDTPISFTYRKIKHGLNDAFVKAGYGTGITYRGKYPSFRIDYIFYGDKMDCTDMDIIKVKYSDHYPVVAYFRKSD